MLRLQPRKWHKKISLALQLLLLSACAHCILLGALFCFYQGESKRSLTLTLNKRALSAGAPVVFRRISLGQPAVKKCIGQSVSAPPSSAVKTRSVHAVKTVSAQRISEKNTKPVHKSKSVIHSSPKVKKQSVPQKNPSIKKAVAPPKKIKKNGVKNKVPETLKAVVQPVVKNIEQQPVPVPPPVDPIAPVEGSSFKQVAQDEVPFDSQEIVLDMSAVTIASAKELRALQEEISNHWAPPKGIDPECVCTVEVEITRQGKVSNVKVAESSGVLMYDSTARAALYKAVFPEWMYGTRLTIAFRQ